MAVKAPTLILLALLFTGCEQQPTSQNKPYTKPTPTTAGRYPIKLDDRAAEIEQKIDSMDAELRRIEMEQGRREK